MRGYTIRTILNRSRYRGELKHYSNFIKTRIIEYSRYESMRIFTNDFIINSILYKDYTNIQRRHFYNSSLYDVSRIANNPMTSNINLTGV